MQPRIFAAAVYFFYFAAGGSLVPYLNLYYQTIGMSKQQIGVLIASTTLTAVVAAPVWSVLADAFRLHRYLLPLATFGTLGPVALLAQSTEFTVLWLLVVLYALFNGSIVALADNAVLSLLGEDRAAYGKLRLWGAVGFGMAA
ncbi:MAG TPA: MFS transporter, partial [Spirillospora sp.]|nr:MFS transporter [Spirillospora sp.]